MSKRISGDSGKKLIQRGKKGLVQFLFGRSMVVLLLLLIQVVWLFAQMYLLGKKIPFLAGSGAALVVVMSLVILNTSRHDPSVKLSWCILIAVLPAFGTLLYLYVRNDLGYRVDQKIVGDSIQASRAYQPDQTPLLEQIRLEDPYLYGFARYLRNFSGAEIARDTRVTYFSSGEAMLETMLEKLNQAKSFIFLEYFIIGRGEMWSRILEILTRKARQGVEVRVMYDGTCAITQLPYGYPGELRKLGLRCKMFSPLRPLVSTHYNNRDHRKILVIDGEVAFTGGVNLADEYINLTHPFGHWKDTALMVEGPGTRGFTRMFLELWNATEKDGTYEPWLEQPAGRLCHRTPGYVIPFGDSPMDTERVGETVYIQMLNQAREYVYIMTPYLILDNVTLTALKMAAKRGVDVRLILPHIPDKKYAFVLAKSHYRELREAGVKLYEYTPGFIHAKVFLSDDRAAVVGTINLDYRSLYHHFECGAFLYEVPALEDIKADFRDTFAKSHRVTWQDIRSMGILTRLSGAVLKFVAPLM